VFSGNSGWHRAHLIDIAYRNFFDWWLVGTRSVAKWDIAYDLNGDITNQYIAWGIDGGLITFSLFITIIVRCFSGVGRILRTLKEQPRGPQIFIWSLGAALFAHVVNFLSISYFDQNTIAWYMLLAMISSLSNDAAEHRRAAGVVPTAEPKARSPMLNVRHYPAGTWARGRALWGNGIDELPVRSDS
jgi:hypothetical protein